MARIGDVIEIPTTKGLAYGQYTHEHTDHPVWGGLIRVLQGFYKNRPSNGELEKIVNLPHRFSTFLPVKGFVKKGIFEVVGNFSVPDFAKQFPIFKGTNAPPNSDPKEAIWWLWDGKKSWKVGKLSMEEQKKYPSKVIYNDTGFIHAVETGKKGKLDLC